MILNNPGNTWVYPSLQAPIYARSKVVSSSYNNYFGVLKTSGLTLKFDFQCTLYCLYSCSPRLIDTDITLDTRQKV